MIVTIDQTARTLSVDVGYVAAMAQEPVTFEGAPPPDGHYVGLLDESGTVLALSVISGGSAEMNLMTRQAYDFIASAPVGVPQEATLCVGSADSLIATGRINVVRNWLQDIVPPDDMAPSYPTTEALLNILKQVNDAANASGDYYARIKEANANLGPATREKLGLVRIGRGLNVDADGAIYPDAWEEPFGPLEGYKVTEHVLGIAWSVYFAAFVQNGKLIAIYGQNQYDVYVCHGGACKRVINIGARYNMKGAWQESDDSVKIVYTTADGDYRLATIVDGGVTDTVTIPNAQGNRLGSSRAVIPFGGYLVTTEGLIFDPSDLTEVGTFTAPVFNRLIFSEDGESLVFAAEGDLSRITRMTLSADGVPSFTYVSRLGDKTLRAFAMPDGSCLLCKAFSDAGGGAILATSATRLSEPYLYDATGGCLVAFKTSVQLPYGMLLCADGLKTVRAVKGPTNPSYSFVEVVDVYRRNFGYFGNPYSQAVGDYAFATPMNSKGDFAVFASLYYANPGGEKANRYWMFTKEA